MRQSKIRSALVLGVILGVTAGAHTASAQIVGRVRAAAGGVVAGAKVEVWNHYPSGAILVSGTTDAGGNFSLAAQAVDSFDLRVRKDTLLPGLTFRSPLYYPTVVRRLPHPTTNAIVTLVALPQVAASRKFADFWDDSSTFIGPLMALGDVIEVTTQAGQVCGVAQAVHSFGSYSLHSFGDDPSTPLVAEGPPEGAQVSFRVNGLAATTSSPFYFYDQTSNQARLTGPANVPGITVIGPLDGAGTAGNMAAVVFQVMNTGQVAGNFTVAAELDQPWTVDILAPSSPLALNPGASASVVARVHIPGGTPDMLTEVRLLVKSDSYGSANSGAWTALSVTLHSDVGSGTGGLLPNQFSLAQNYPNPFNPSTEIAYSLRMDGMVRLEVINLLGQKVRTLVDGFRAQGIHYELWDGRDDQGATVPSGIYFYRLVQKDQSLVRKMVLLK